jgi:NAD(P)-dependent dehydrogenase (short-subunit alcohol dehydrogenase family)
LLGVLARCSRGNLRLSGTARERADDLMPRFASTKRRPAYRATPEDGIAWVTGASAGIGRAVALELVRRGYRVAATARRVDELDRLANDEPRIVSYPGDVTDRAGMARLVARIESEQGAIALAFLNAGIYFPAERKGFSAEVAWRTIEINVGGTMNGLDPLVASMRQRGKGQIAINSSLAGYTAVLGSSGYGASKAALTYLAEVLKLTYDRDGLVIQVVNPGFVRTHMVAHVDFEMPFVMEADRAARIICDGFERGGFEIAFPRRLAYAVKLASILPYPLTFYFMRRLTARARR